MSIFFPKERPGVQRAGGRHWPQANCLFFLGRVGEAKSSTENSSTAGGYAVAGCGFMTGKYAGLRISDACFGRCGTGAGIIQHGSAGYGEFA